MVVVPVVPPAPSAVARRRRGGPQPTGVQGRAEVRGGAVAVVEGAAVAHLPGRGVAAAEVVPGQHAGAVGALVHGSAIAEARIGVPVGVRTARAV
eukprot:COSAG03_NODE_1520_length_3939_cov_189.146354_3_plen_95_part_00